MDQRNVNLPSPAPLGRLGGFQPSFFRPPRLQRWGFYNFLLISNPQLWRYWNPRFLLHLPVFLWARGFWATGPSDAILHVSRALCLSLPLHGACPSRPHGKLACPGTEKQVTVLYETEQTGKAIRTRTQGSGCPVSTFSSTSHFLNRISAQVTAAHFISLFFCFTSLLIHGV